MLHFIKSSLYEFTVKDRVFCEETFIRMFSFNPDHKRKISHNVIIEPSLFALELLLEFAERRLEETPFREYFDQVWFN